MSEIRSGNIASIRMHPRPSEGRWSKDMFESFAEREVMLKMLTEADTTDAVAAAVSFLLHAADTQPQVLRAVLRAGAAKPGVPLCEIIDVLNHAAGKG